MPQFDEVMGVQPGVIEVVFLQGAFAPVVALPLFIQHHAEVFFQDLGEAELLFSQEFAGNGRIENVIDPEIEISFESQDIVGCGVKDFFDGRVFKDCAQGAHVFHCQGIDHVVLIAGGDLNEAESLEIGVKAVRFGIYGDVTGVGQLLGQFGELRLLFDDDERIHQGVFRLPLLWYESVDQKGMKMTGKKKKKDRLRDSAPSGRTDPPTQEFYTPFRVLDQQLAKISRPVAPKAPVSVPKPPPPAPEKIDDERLFLEAMAGVVAIPEEKKGFVPTLPPAKTPPKFFAREESETLADLVDLVTGYGPFELSWSDEYVEGFVAGLSPKILKKLRKGEFSYQDFADLHGLYREQAEAKTVNFMQRSFAKGLRCVLIVSGRGLNSRDKEPVLKTGLVHWLTHAPLKRMVLAFSSARPHDGGAGAFYVLLRRNEGKGKFVTPVA